MKDIYPGFYSPTDDALEIAWKSENTLFVFDTNTLLNLYGYASQTREDFFSILEKISDRIWIPYHVGLEYQRRRLSVVKEEKGIFKKIESVLENIEKIIENDFSELALNRRFPDLHENTQNLNTEIKKSISSYRESVSYWDKKQPCVRGHDLIREKLTQLFEGKIGDAPENQKFLDEIYKEGRLRYENNVPPGYKDLQKSKEAQDKFCYSGLEYDRQYGDLIIWKQIITKAKQQEISSIIFITDDAKEDWWYIINSRGEKNIGPRAELREEIFKEAKINLFEMYNTSGFLDNGEKLLSVNVKAESIDEANTAFFDQVKNRNNLEKILNISRFISNDTLRAIEKARQPIDLDAIKNTYNLYNSNEFFGDIQRILNEQKIKDSSAIHSAVEKIKYSFYRDKLDDIYERINQLDNVNTDDIFGLPSNSDDDSPSDEN